MAGTPVQPEGWADPNGYSNGMFKPAGKFVAVAGQIGWDAACKFVGDGFAEQFRQALDNVTAVVRAAGGDASDIIQLRIYVTDKTEYTGAIKDVGAAYRETMGKHYPAMALLEVKGLLEDRAKVEIEALAII